MTEKPYKVMPRKFFGNAVHVGPPGTPVTMTPGGYCLGFIKEGQHFTTPGVIWTTPEGWADLEKAYVESSPFVWCAPGDRQADVWILRFDDRDRREMVFEGENAEADARAAWALYCGQHGTWNCSLFQLAKVKA